RLFASDADEGQHSRRRFTRDLIVAAAAGAAAPPPDGGPPAAGGGGAAPPPAGDPSVAAAFASLLERFPSFSEATITVSGTVHPTDPLVANLENPEFNKEQDREPGQWFTLVTIDGRATRLPVSAVEGYSVGVDGILQLKLAAGKLTPEQK